MACQFGKWKIDAKHSESPFRQVSWSNRQALAATAYISRRKLIEPLVVYLKIIITDYSFLWRTFTCAFA